MLYRKIYRNCIRTHHFKQ